MTLIPCDQDRTNSAPILVTVLRCHDGRCRVVLECTRRRNVAFMSAPSLPTASPVHPTIDSADGIGIAEMASAAGLTADTLRWWEREGLIPVPPRTATGRRIFTPRLVAAVQLLVRLRETGMPTADMRQFVSLIAGGSATHHHRVEILSAHRSRIAERQRQLDAARDALEAKISHYQELISLGLDCDGAPNRTDTREQD